MTSKNFLSDIEAFHKRFQIEYNGPPRQLPKDLSEFRQRFLSEELDEYMLACDENDIEGQFDALIDLVYVALGTAHMQGFPFQEGWDEVQRANMTKVRALQAKDSKRGSTFDVVKPEGWKPPDLRTILSNAVWVSKITSEKHNGS